MFCLKNSFVKVFLVLVIISLAVAVPTMAYSATNMVKITGDLVNVRSGPAITYDKVASVSLGQQYQLNVKGNGWYKIALGDGKYGWVSADYCKIITVDNTPTTTTTTTKLPSDYNKYAQGMVNVNDLNLREGPSTSYKSKAKLYEGTGVAIYLTSGSWYKVYTSNGQVGWVSSHYVTLKNAKVSAVKIEEPIAPPVVEPPEPTSLYPGSVQEKLIYLDPGHGTYNTENGALDNGASGFGLQEKDIAYAITQKVANLLSDLGADVRLTRTDEPKPMSLYDRADLANNANADLFISIHCNAFTNSEANGTSVWFYAPRDNVSYDRESRQLLAQSIQDALVEETGLRNYGVREANFAVTRETNMTSVLIETAFISNPTDNAYLASEDGQAALARGIVRGICDFIEQVNL